MRIIIVLFVVIISACSSSKQATIDKNKNSNVLNKNDSVLSKTVFILYNFKIISPQENDKMFFEDANIYSKFSITSQQISFGIKNKGRNPIKILWDEASMIAFNKSQRIIHSGIKYIDRNNSMPPTSILPNSILDDMALPIGNIYFSEGYGSDIGSWDAHGLLPSSLVLPRDSSLLKDLNNEQLTLYLPMETAKNQRLGYTFKFIVTVAKLE